MFGDWSANLNETWLADSNYTPAQRTAFVTKASETRKAEETKRHEDAARRALAIWQAAVPAEDHPYFTKKGVKAYGLRVHNGDLIVPCFIDDRLATVQRISPDGQKKFIHGGAKKAGYYLIGESFDTILVAEGYATGATLHEGTGHAVAVAFDAGNLKPVALAIRRDYPAARIVICGDDDYRTEGNPGRTKAIEAAQACGGAWVLPEFGLTREEQDSDFNDLVQRQGWGALESLKKKISGMDDDNDPFSWMEAFTVSEQDMAKYADPEWFYPDLIISGHLVVIAGEPGSGKTTILMHVAAILAKKGLRVFYVNCDTGGADAKQFHAHSAEHGYTLLLPDIATGGSVDLILSNLENMAASAGDFSDSVIVLDTLKKFTDVLSKQRVKETFNLFRRLTAKSMTVVCNAHTNKYYDHEGFPIFEGVGDVRADCDDLLYFIPQRNEDESLTVSTKPSSKVRGNFKPITFTISQDRHVSQRQDYVDVADARQRALERENDSPTIEVITEAIRAEHFTEARIIAYAKDSGTGIGKRSILRVLRRYRGELWVMERTFQCNARQYFLIEEGAPC